MTCSHWLADVWEVSRLVFCLVLHLAGEYWTAPWSALPTIFTAPLGRRAYLCHWLWQSVCDLCNTFQCSSDCITFFHIVLACSSSASLVRSSRKSVRFFCDAFCILLVRALQYLIWTSALLAFVVLQFNTSFTFVPTSVFFSVYICIDVELLPAFPHVSLHACFKPFHTWFTTV